MGGGTAMLRKNPESKAAPGSGSGTFAIIASRYNARYVDAMLRAAKTELWRAEVSRIQIIRVPGAYEIPLVAKRLARTVPGLSAIVCLGVVLRGHDDHDVRCVVPSEAAGRCVPRSGMGRHEHRPLPCAKDGIEPLAPDDGRFRSQGFGALPAQGFGEAMRVFDERPDHVQLLL